MMVSNLLGKKGRFYFLAAVAFAYKVADAAIGDRELCDKVCETAATPANFNLLGGSM